MAENEKKDVRVNINDIEEEMSEKEMDKTKGGAEFLISAFNNNNIVLEGEINNINDPGQGRGA